MFFLLLLSLLFLLLLLSDTKIRTKCMKRMLIFHFASLCCRRCCCYWLALKANSWYLCDNMRECRTDSSEWMRSVWRTTTTVNFISLFGAVVCCCWVDDVWMSICSVGWLVGWLQMLSLVLVCHTVWCFVASSKVVGILR